MKNKDRRSRGILLKRRHTWRIYSHGLFAGQDRGATAAEYAIILAFISGALFLAVNTFGQAVAGLFRSAATAW
jgi:Flp pilus assembly pilin Flp